MRNRPGKQLGDGILAADSGRRDPGRCLSVRRSGRLTTVRSTGYPRTPMGVSDSREGLPSYMPRTGSEGQLSQKIISCSPFYSREKSGILLRPARHRFVPPMGTGACPRGPSRCGPVRAPRRTIFRRRYRRYMDVSSVVQKIYNIENDFELVHLLPGAAPDTVSIARNPPASRPRPARIPG